MNPNKTLQKPHLPETNDRFGRVQCLLADDRSGLVNAAPTVTDISLMAAAGFARLPWPVRAIGAIFDFIFRRPSKAPV
jgi:hypothetical protein